MSVRLLVKLAAGLFAFYLVLIWSGNLPRPAWMLPDIEPLVGLVAALMNFVSWWEELLAYARSTGPKSEMVQQPAVQVHVHTPAASVAQTDTTPETQNFLITLPQAEYSAVRDAVVSGETAKALELLARTPDAGDAVARLQARFAAYQRKIVAGTAEGPELRAELNQINDAVLQAICLKEPYINEGLIVSSSYRLNGSHDERLWLPEELLGREKQLKEILIYLNDPNCRALTVYGEAGMGKTDLCREVLKEYLSQNPNNVAYWIDVENISTTSELIGQLAHLSGLPKASSENDIYLALASLPGLYYLDNLESVAGDHELRPLLNRLLRIKGVRWLASSREVFGGWGDNYQLSELDDTNACKLFCRNWNKHSFDKLLLEDDRLRRFVVGQLGCHPLSIILTASHADFPNLKSVIDAWSTQLSTVGKLYAGDPKHRLSNLSVSLHLSLKHIEHLSGAVRLWSLSILFPNGMDSDAQDFFISHNIFSLADRSGLIQRSILRMRNRCLGIIPPFARFAEEKLIADLDGFSAQQLLEDALPYALEFMPETYPISDELLQKWLDRLPFVFNLLNFYGNLSRIHSEDCIKLHCCMLKYYSRNVRFGRIIIKKLLKKSDFSSDNNMMASMYLTLGDLELRMNHNSAALKLYEEALLIYENTDYLEGKACALLGLGVIKMQIGDIQASRSLFELSFSFFNEIGNDLDKARVLLNWGSLEMLVDDYEKAYEFYKQALTLFEKGHDDFNKANVLVKIGDIELVFGQNNVARDLYEEASSLYKKLGVELECANTLKRWGDIEVLLMENDKARDLYKKAYEMFENLNDDLAKANVNLSMGDLEVQVGEIKSAYVFYESALQIYDRVESNLGKANALKSLGDLAKQMNEVEKAREFYKRSKSLFEKEGDILGKAKMLSSWSALEYLAENIEDARTLYYDALYLYEKLDDNLSKASTLKSLGDLERLMSENAKARALYEQALPLYEKVGDDLGKANVFWSLGMLDWYNEKKNDQAVDHWETAVRLYRKVGYKEYLANTLARLARAWQQAGDNARACAALAEAESIAAALGIPDLSALVEEVKDEVNCPE